MIPKNTLKAEKFTETTDFLPSDDATCSASPGNAIPRDQPWHIYANGTKAPSCGGGHWVRVTGGWKWCSGDVFSHPGGDNMDQVILPANQLIVSTSGSLRKPFKTSNLSVKCRTCEGTGKWIDEMNCPDCTPKNDH
jgi:hypothetical protein